MLLTDKVCGSRALCSEPATWRRQWQSTLCLGVWRPAISASCLQERPSCHRTSLRLDTNTRSPLMARGCSVASLTGTFMLSLEWSQVQRNSPKMHLGKIQGEQVESSPISDRYLRCVRLSSTALLFDVWLFFCLMYNYVWAYLRGPLASLALYLWNAFNSVFAISSCKSTISIMLGWLCWCPLFLLTPFQKWGGWKKEGVEHLWGGVGQWGSVCVGGWSKGKGGKPVL